MSTLHSLELAVIDMTERMQRELQFSSDAKKNVRNAFDILHDAVEAVEKAVNSAIDERMRALSAAIGTGQPTPETVDHVPEKKKARLEIEEATADAE